MGLFRMAAYRLKKSIVLIGLMGAGKSSIGRKLAEEITVSFVDADEEIELAAGMSIPEIFKVFGEPYFRSGEERVMERLISGVPQIIATGGGAFLSPKIRSLIQVNAFSIWLKADFTTLWTRVKGKGNRPLLQVESPEVVLKKLIKERSPFYEKADLTVLSKRYTTHSAMVAKILKLLGDRNELERIDCI